MVNSVWVAAVDSGVGAGQGRGVRAAISRVFGGAQLAIALIRPTSLAPAVCEDLCKPIEPKWLCVCLMLLLLLPARGCPTRGWRVRPSRQRQPWAVYQTTGAHHQKAIKPPGWRSVFLPVIPFTVTPTYIAAPVAASPSCRSKFDR